MATDRKAGKRPAGPQRGGFVIGLVVGLLVGLALALGVALYVTKVPVPFIDKVPQRTAEQDAQEAERNKRWDPNAPLAGKPAQRPPAASGVAASGVTAPSPAPAPTGTAASSASPTAAAASRPARDPAAILAGAPAAAAPAAPAASAAASAARSTGSAVDAFSYFVQVGAYSRSEDAEAQRAKLGMLGFTAKVTEREQSGRTVYRVRLGPFDRKEAADQTQDRLRESAVESALVRVERSSGQ